MTKKRWSKIEEKIHAPSKLKYAADNSLTFQSKDTSVVKFHDDSISFLAHLAELIV